MWVICCCYTAGWRCLTCKIVYEQKMSFPIVDIGSGTKVVTGTKVVIDLRRSDES